MLVEGRGVDANPEEGRAWIKRAADVGMVEAEVLLAEMMLNGRGGPKDHPGALALFEKAAGRGHVGAMFAMGAMHGGGHEVPVDRPSAQRWFRAAAERGHAYAQMMLGRYLARGLAGERDFDRARVWLDRALAQGLQEARNDLAALPPPGRTRAGRTAGSRPLTRAGRATPTLALEAFERGQAEVAAGNGAEARRWLDRACRLAPRDQTLALALATACLGHDDMRAAALFGAISAENDVREAWLGLATARRRLGDAAGAAAALAAALRRHVPDPGFAALADAIAREAGAPGWCGLSGDGALTVRPTPGDVAGHAGRGAAPRPDPAPARGGGGFAVTAPDGRHFLGSPIDVAAITAAVGCVRGKDGGLTGWAWHPGDPNVDPVLTIRPATGRGRITITASDTDVRIDNSGLLGRPRGFTVPPAALARAERIAACAGSRRQGPAGQPARPTSRAGSRRRRGRHAGPALSGWRRPPHRVRSRRRRYRWLRCSRPWRAPRRDGGRRSMWWCRCMAAPTTRSPASTACWPACGARAG